jgi:hypothetical protein
MLLILDKCERISWVSKVNHILFAYGFGYVWISQSIGNSQLCLCEFRQRLRDTAFQNWEEASSDSPKLANYSLLKTQLLPELYLSVINVVKFRTALSVFKVSSHCLQIEVDRHNNTVPEERFCKHCVSLNMYVVEDEKHMLLVCPLYSNLRQKYGLDHIDLITEYTHCTNLKDFNSGGNSSTTLYHTKSNFSHGNSRRTTNATHVVY